MVGRRGGLPAKAETWRDITETVTLLARMARFFIADLAEPSSIPKELEAIAPQRRWWFLLCRLGSKASPSRGNFSNSGQRMIAVSGSVIGIDVGCSPTRRSSAICRIDWSETKIAWEIARFRAQEAERKSVIAHLLLAVRSLQQASTVQSSEALTSSPGIGRQKGC